MNQPILGTIISIFDITRDGELTFLDGAVFIGSDLKNATEIRAMSDVGPNPSIRRTYIAKAHIQSESLIDCIISSKSTTFYYEWNRDKVKLVAITCDTQLFKLLPYTNENLYEVFLPILK